MLDEPLIELVNEPISIDETMQRVQHSGCGAFVVFSGTVRDEHHGRAVERLEYSAYEPMAHAKMVEIAETAAKQWPLQKCAMIHRLGTLEIGEMSILIVLALPHRKESFAALQYCIDRFKEIVPIWKKEYFTDGEAVWVEGS